MQSLEIPISENYRKGIVRSIFAIIGFVLFYLFLLAIALGIVFISLILAYFLAFEVSHLLGLLGAAGVLGFSMLILFFLIKFLFKTSKTDYSTFIEIKKKDEPRLFKLIEDLTAATNTKMPAKVFISPDVNAAVFYNSSFWSMFFPVRKNLVIGLGLVNATSLTELKGILAHEFGHFSQRSMKVGSYVYFVNKIIYNLLNDNEGLDKFATSWASLHGFFAFFTRFAIEIIKSFQKALEKVYGWLNKQYYQLSREMEFHADAIATQIVGAEPMIKSLRRLDFANHAFVTTLGFYENRIQDAHLTANIYPQFDFVMQHLAQFNALPQNIIGLPEVEASYVARYNPSTLVIKDQWASHPTNQERSEAMLKSKSQVAVEENLPAGSIFENLTRWQENSTRILFEQVNYDKPTFKLDLKEFKDAFVKAFSDQSFAQIFHNYYDLYNPFFPNNTEASQPVQLQISDLFSTEKVDNVLKYLSARNDLHTLNSIASGELKIKSFDYNGIKYRKKDALNLIPVAEDQINKLENIVKAQDYQIFHSVARLSDLNNQTTNFEEHINHFKINLENYENMGTVFNNLVQNTSFMSQTLQFAEIMQYVRILKEVEIPFKSALNEILQNPAYGASITQEYRTIIKDYVLNDADYFSNQTYIDKEIENLMQIIHLFSVIIEDSLFKTKKAMLNYFAATLDVENPTK